MTALTTPPAKVSEPEVASAAMVTVVLTVGSGIASSVIDVREES